MLLAETDNLILELLQYIPQANAGSLDWFDPGAHPVGALLLLIIVAPLTEEHLFRGMILRGLLTRHRIAVAIFLSALLFGILHANLRQLFLGTVIGGVFGWWCVRTASLGPGLLGHALFNSVAYVAALLPEATFPLVHNAPGHPILHQPWWLTVAGIALVGSGLWWFDRMAVPSAPAEPPMLVAAGLQPPLVSGSPQARSAAKSATGQPADSPAS
ncbi:MAG: CPBP family intramembrane glutamic endopeptidase [Verrucomicrobiota bacterium]